MIYHNKNLCVSIIIPSIKYNKLLEKCVNELLSQTINKEIIIVADENLSSFFSSKNNVRCFILAKATMSAKRNLAVKMAKFDYLAFIDSDAYPHKLWLINGIRILKTNNNIGIVGGPDISQPDQTYWENISGIASKSYLIRGNTNFVKKISKSREVEMQQTCNMIISKKDFLNINGFDENIYVAEDLYFCKKIINNLNKKIFFSNRVIVFHRDRNFLGFFIQRLTRGIANIDIFKLMLKEFKLNKKISAFRMELFIPILFLFFIFSFPIILIVDLYKYIYFFVILIYFIVIFFESIRLSISKKDVFPVALTMTIGTLAPAFGFVLRIIKVFSNNRILKFYKNKNDI